MGLTKLDGVSGAAPQPSAGAVAGVVAPRAEAPQAAAQAIQGARPVAPDSFVSLALAGLQPRQRSLRLLGVEEVYAKLQALEALGAQRVRLGESRGGRSIDALEIGSGPIQVAAIAGAHPDEPVGTLTCLFLAERLLTDPRLAGLRQQVSLRLVPMANPDGTAKNEAWFARWGGKPDLLAYLVSSRRDTPKDDVEFGFPSAPNGEARPENRAIAAYFDSLGQIDHYVSLHSMFIGGGALYLAMADPLSAMAAKLRFLLDQAQAHGMPLHDKDRGGQKGFHRICAGLQTAPTGEAMRAFFEQAGATAEAQSFKLNSMQYVQANAGCPLALVSEIPLCFDPRIASMKELAVSRTDLEVSYARSVIAVLDEAAELAQQIGAAPLAQPKRRALEGLLESIGSGRSAARAQEADAGRFAGQMATEGNALENKLNLCRRRAALLARARDLTEGRPELAALGQDIDRRLDTVLAELERDFELKHPSLETQVHLQIASILAALVGARAGGSET